MIKLLFFIWLILYLLVSSISLIPCAFEWYIEFRFHPAMCELSLIKIYDAPFMTQAQSVTYTQNLRLAA